ncbi:HNH endonuclease [Burkholderia glumae]|uniref:HNH endonuclease n=1 Tax=Burkholderia glumae TaxID=337 RepID=UPI001C11D0FF|nr:HNH endonuclease [Burkholderia glumae]
MPRHRDPNIEASPSAHNWTREHPEAAANLRRIVCLLLAHYAGDDHGFINRASNEVEYRLAPMPGDSIRWNIQVVARAKHVVVRFPVYRPRRRGPWKTKPLKSAHGDDYFAVDIKVRSEDDLAYLEGFIKTTNTFSKTVMRTGHRAEVHTHKTANRRTGDSTIRFHRFNIGLPTTSGRLDAWWDENIKRGVITTGFDGMPGGRGERQLLALKTGDWVLAYAKRYGYVGAGRVLGAETYVLHKRVPAGSNSNHRHERSVRWCHVIREVEHAVSIREAGLGAPRHTRELVKASATDLAEHLIALLRERGSNSVTETGRRRTVIEKALATAEEAVEADSSAISSEEDGRQRAMQAVVVRRGQGKFRTALIKAYQSMCAVTGCTAIDVLEAAHIIPYLGDHTNHPNNGLLLRSDIHALFDLGRLWIDPDKMLVCVADELHQTEYGKLHGRALKQPAYVRWRPHRDHLRIHAKLARRVSARST